MSSTFAPDLNCEVSLSEHRERWNSILSEIGASQLSDSELWANPKIQNYTQWPVTDQHLMANWNALSELVRDDLSSLNLSNTNCVRLMRCLGIQDCNEPSGRESVADLRIRIAVAQAHETDSYLVGRLDDLRCLCDKTEMYGFTHISWA